MTQDQSDMTRRGALALALLATTSARAQGGPIRIVSGFAAGGSQDILARILADELASALSTTVIVENRTGASGTIAGEAVKNAPADGSSILIANIVTMSLAPFTFPGLKYDPIKDFEALAKTTEFPVALATGAMTKAKSFADILAWLKANPDKANIGVPATGSLPHLYAARLAQSAGLKLTVVPYRGGAPVAQDLMAGQLALGFGATADFSELHLGQKLLIVGTSGTARHPALADIPTFTELGVKGLETNGWNGLFLPAKTPPALVQRYNDIIVKALNKPEVRAKLVNIGFHVTPSSPQGMREQIEAEMRDWGPLMKELVK